jgi:Zn-dependent protease with chaperone function
MEPAVFRELVKRLEPVAAARPWLYRLRVAALAALGYGYILGVLLLLIAVTVAALVVGKALAVKIVIPLLVVIGVVVRALWVTMPPPGGRRLQEREVPRLFEMVRMLARRLRAPVHVILARPDVNAAVHQVPRLGIFGWSRNYLVVGLPLLQATSPEEWQAILAHELGHLSANHGRFSAWVYRHRETWSRLQAELDHRDSKVGRFFFGEFLKWYAPYFNAYTFVLARAHEYEADRASAEIVGEEIARRALIRTELASWQEQQFWAAIDDAVAESPEPLPDAMERLGAAVAVAPAAEHGTAWLTHALSRATAYDDTHPALAERLRALGWRPATPDELPSPPPPLDGPSAARVYLGETEAVLSRHIGSEWAAQVREAWGKQHRNRAHARKRLAELDARPAGSLTPDEEWELVAWSAELGDEERAEACAAALAERAPDHANAHYYLGRCLLSRGDASGVAHIEVGMRDPALLRPGCELLFQWHISRNEVEEAERYRSRAAGEELLRLQAGEERRRIDRQAQLEPHDFPAERVALLRTQLTRVSELAGGRAYLVRRVTRIKPEVPCYVLGVAAKTRWWSLRSVKQDVRLREAVAQGLTDFPGLYIFSIDRIKGLRKKMEMVPGSLVI